MAFDLFERRQAALAVSTDEVGAHTVIAGISLTLEQQRAIETAGFSVSGERDTLQLFPHPDDSTLGLLADMHRVDLVDTRSIDIPRRPTTFDETGFRLRHDILPEARIVFSAYPIVMRRTAA